MSDWHPIATAPRNGSKILVCGVPNGCRSHLLRSQPQPLSAVSDKLVKTRRGTGAKRRHLEHSSKLARQVRSDNLAREWAKSMGIHHTLLPPLFHPRPSEWMFRRSE